MTVDLGGRPTKYKEEYNEQAYKLCLLGSTDVQLAEFFDVCEATINNWKIEFPIFLESLKRGKIAADAEIASSLYNRAKGLTVIKQQAIKLKESEFNSEGKKISESESIEIVDLEDEVPPDTTAAIFWLKNRNPDRWRDKQPLIVDEDDSNEVTINVVRISKKQDSD